MNDKQNKVDQEVQRTLTSLDKHRRLEGNPYLYTRIKQKLSEDKRQANGIGLLLDKLQPVFFVSLLLVNIFTAYSVFENSTTEEDDLERIAAEYMGSVDLSNYYILD